jgi:hypothetical protein
MRLSLSFKILPGVRAGISFGGRRRTRIYATERLGRHLRATESRTLGSPRRRRRTR